MMNTIDIISQEERYLPQETTLTANVPIFSLVTTRIRNPVFELFDQEA